jgi:H+/Cl- antiporter ClcA
MPRRLVQCPACRQWTKPGRCQWCDQPVDPGPAGTENIEDVRSDPPVFARWGYGYLRGLLRFETLEHLALLRYLGKWLLLGGVIGVGAGLSAGVFLVALAWATTTREGNVWLLAALPVGGFAIGLVYHYVGGRSAEGNNLIIDSVHGLTRDVDLADRRHGVPLRMAPLVLVGTVVTHLFGGSAGREGTGIQMSGALGDTFARVARLSPQDRKTALVAAISGGFGAVFGVPMAGTVFGLEVLSVGRIRYEALVPGLVAAVTGDLVAHLVFDATGLPHMPTPRVVLEAVPIETALLGKVAVAGLAFGLASILFSEMVYGFRRAYRIAIAWAPARPLVGGLVVIGLTLLVGSTDYLGLSLPLIERSYVGDVVAWAFLLKILFTTLTIGAGFQGGEVTPLFVVGATLGAVLAGPLGVSPELLAALGLVAVFAGATNTPLACTIMGVELFGSGAFVYLAVACVVSYVFSSHRSIYETQRIDTPKGATTVDQDTLMRDLIQRRRPWLPGTGPGRRRRRRGGPASRT